MPEAPIACAGCREPIEGARRKTFLGFRVFTCPSCDGEVLEPLGRSTRIAYWVVLALAVTVVTIGALAGDVRLPGAAGAVLLAVVVYTLVRDRTLRQLASRRRRAAKPRYQGRHDEARIARRRGGADRRSRAD